MGKMIPKETRSGKKVVRNVAFLTFASCMGFSASSNVPQGGLLHFMVGASLLLLVFAAFEAVQWMWRTNSNRGATTPL